MLKLDSGAVVGLSIILGLGFRPRVYQSWPWKNQSVTQKEMDSNVNEQISYLLY